MAGTARAGTGFRSGGGSATLKGAACSLRHGVAVPWQRDPEFVLAGFFKASFPREMKRGKRSGMPEWPAQTEGPFPYSARAVLHIQENPEAMGEQLARYYVNAAAIFGSAACSWGIGRPSVSYLGGDGDYFLRAAPMDNGQIMFSLRPSVLQFFRRYIGEECIEVYYEVSINSRRNVIQMIVPVRREFYTKDYNAICRHVDTDDSMLAHGEWHAVRCIDGIGDTYALISTTMAGILADGAPIYFPTGIHREIGYEA